MNLVFGFGVVYLCLQLRFMMSVEEIGTDVPWLTGYHRIMSILVQTLEHPVSSHSFTCSSDLTSPT